MIENRFFCGQQPSNLMTDHWPETPCPPAPFLGPEASSSENTVGANMTYAAAGSKGALGLSFSGGSGSIASLSWRDGRFSDWTVQVGDKFYKLHAFLLARASLFFESHMSIAARTEQGNAKGSDLTEVLPTSCHSAFEEGVRCRKEGISMPDLLVVAEDRMIANNLTKLRPQY
eukprot:symbB.v1.2.040243.t1/scaffold7097.1/size28137/1